MAVGMCSFPSVTLSPAAARGSGSPSTGKVSGSRKTRVVLSAGRGPVPVGAPGSMVAVGGKAAAGTCLAMLVVEMRGRLWCVCWGVYDGVWECE